jgi:Glutamine amidotransferase domain
MSVSSPIRIASQELKEPTVKWDLPQPETKPRSMRVVLNRDMSWTKPTQKHLGIRAYAEHHGIEQISADNGDIVILFQGRLFDEQSPQVVIDLYKKHGIQYVLKKLQGVFAFILLDQSYKNEESVLYVVTDTFSFKPIYYYQEPGTNIVKFSTEYNQNAIPVPSASYCKLTFSNKVSSMWTFDHETYVPTYDRSQSRWIYPSPKFRFHKYRTLSGGILGLYTEPVAITEFLFKQIQASIVRRLEGFHGTVICMGDRENSNEFMYMTKIIQKTNPVKTFYLGRDSFDKFHQEQKPFLVMACSGLLQHEIDKSRRLDGMDSVDLLEEADADIYKYLDTVVQTDLMPKIIEPLKTVGVDVEFPFLEESWLQYYLSIPSKIRYDMYSVWP